MKIHWNQNPFQTTIELDERDKHMILLAYQNERYSDLLCDLDMILIRKDDPLDLDYVKGIVGNWGEICDLTVNSPEVQNVIEDLKYTHAGDCTCIPCTCTRCIAEDMLGINTIEGLGKHSAYRAQEAFGGDGKRTIDEAIESLTEPKEYVMRDAWKNFSRAEFEKHIPRWEKEREAAAMWLKAYKERHGF